MATTDTTTALSTVLELTYAREILFRERALMLGAGGFGFGSQCAYRPDHAPA